MISNIKRRLTKKWMPYQDLLLQGDWHVHTRWTDGRDSVAAYCQEAEKRSLKLIAFTEHVRWNLDYDFAAFSEEVEEAKKQFNLTILKGCEAKVLNTSGELDAPPYILESCDIVLGSFHTFPFPDQYVRALKNLLSNPHVDIWAHPLLFCQRNNIRLVNEIFPEIIELCIQNNVLIEFNRRHDLPPHEFRTLVIGKKAKFVWGSDAHSADDLLGGK